MKKQNKPQIRCYEPTLPNGIVIADEEDDSDTLNAYYEEYKSLRAEVLARVQTQNQAINYVLIIIGVTITALITVLKDAETRTYIPTVITLVMLLLPLFTSPFAFIFFDNEMMIHAIGSLLFFDRRKRVEELVGNSNVFSDVFEFKYLPKRKRLSSKPKEFEETRFLFHRVSRARWFLFYIPIFVPTICIFIYTICNSWWWDKYEFVIPNSKFLIVSLGITTFLVNVYIFYLLCRVGRWLRWNRRLQSARKNVWMKHRKKLK